MRTRTHLPPPPPGAIQKHTSRQLHTLLAATSLCHACSPPPPGAMYCMGGWGAPTRQVLPAAVPGPRACQRHGAPGGQQLLRVQAHELSSTAAAAAAGQRAAVRAGRGVQSTRHFPAPPTAAGARRGQAHSAMALTPATDPCPLPSHPPSPPPSPAPPTCLQYPWRSTPQVTCRARGKPAQASATRVARSCSGSIRGRRR